MKFSTLGKAVRKLNDIGLDDVDIAILHRVDSNDNVMVKDIMAECDFASPATLHGRLTKKLVRAKLLKLESSRDDARTKYVVKGAKFHKLEEVLGGL